MEHTHIPVPVFSEGVDLEENVLTGYACSICGEELISLVPEPNPEYAIAA